jgi:hypothetical protein
MFAQSRSKIGLRELASPTTDRPASVGDRLYSERRVHALYTYADPLVADIKTGVDVLDLKSLGGYRFIVTNLPYHEQAVILAHLLVAARDGVRVAVLARSEWSSAAARRALIHQNARFAGEVRLTKRPEWIRPAIASPRHWFSWFVWSPAPRAPGQDPFLRFAGHATGSSAR